MGSFGGLNVRRVQIVRYIYQMGALAREFVFSVISLTVQINTNCYFLQSPGIYIRQTRAFTRLHVYMMGYAERQNIYIHALGGSYGKAFPRNHPASQLHFTGKYRY